MVALLAFVFGLGLGLGFGLEGIEDGHTEFRFGDEGLAAAVGLTFAAEALLSFDAAFVLVVGIAEVLALRVVF